MDLKIVAFDFRSVYHNIETTKSYLKELGFHGKAVTESTGGTCFVFCHLACGERTE